VNSITYEQLSRLDPTDTTLFKAAVFLDRVLGKIKIWFLVEITRLVLLGFYEDFQDFVRAIDRAEDQSENEAEFRATWTRKSEAAERIDRLVHVLERLGNLEYKGTSLLEYLIGAERLENLRLFVRAAAVEGEGEEILNKAKKEFLAAFAQRRLSQGQQVALMEKYKELVQR
jgi:hypothetical protein